MLSSCPTKEKKSPHSTSNIPYKVSIQVPRPCPQQTSPPQTKAYPIFFWEIQMRVPKWNNEINEIKEMNQGTSKVWGCVGALRWKLRQTHSNNSIWNELAQPNKKGNSCKLNTSNATHLVRTNSNFIEPTTFERRHHSLPYMTFYDSPQGLDLNNIFSQAFQVGVQNWNFYYSETLGIYIFLIKPNLMFVCPFN
jgi:hypothetical protein